MKKKRRKRVYDFVCKLTYQGVTRKCFAHDFREIRYKGYLACKRAFKLNCNMNLEGVIQISQNEWHGETVSVCGKRIHYVIIDLKDRVREAARLMGQIGGQAGRGKKKVRGDSNYYRALRYKGLTKNAKKNDKTDK